LTDESTAPPPTAPVPPAKVTAAKIGKQSLIYGAGILLNRAVSVIMLPVYTRFLTPADYGVMELISMTLDIISIIAGAKLALGVFRYYHKAKTEDERAAVVSTAMIALGVSYLAVGLLAFVSADWLSTLVFRSHAQTSIIRIASVSLAFQSLLIVPLSYARMRDQAVLYIIANALKLVVGLSLNILLVVHRGMGVKGVFIADMTATIIVGTGLGIYLFRMVGFSFSRSATKDLLRFGVPLMATQIATFILTFGDRYFLQRSATTTDVGLYSLAYQFGFLLAMVGFTPFALVWEPARFEIAKRPDRESVLSRGFIYLNVLLMTLAVGIALFVHDALVIMATPQFTSAADIVPIILLAYVFQCWANVHDIGILVREKTEWITAATWIAAGVALGGYALLIPSMRGLGAAIATLVAFAARYVLTYVMSQRLWKVHYQWRPVATLMAISLLVVLAGYALPNGGIIASLTERTVLFAVYVAAVWRAGVLSEADRVLVRQLLRQSIASLRPARAA
jgi:O-antigen/teichoic acid export membrane protein